MEFQTFTKNPRSTWLGWAVMRLMGVNSTKHFVPCVIFERKKYVCILLENQAFLKIILSLKLTPHSCFVGASPDLEVSYHTMLKTCP